MNLFQNEKQIIRIALGFLLDSGSGLLELSAKEWALAQDMYNKFGQENSLSEEEKEVLEMCLNGMGEELTIEQEVIKNRLNDMITNGRIRIYE
jgi:hypothetical protein